LALVTARPGDTHPHRRICSAAHHPCVRRHISQNAKRPQGWQNVQEQSIEFAERFGGRDRDRTGDPLLAKQVLSQLSYTPTREAVLILKHFPTFLPLHFMVSTLDRARTVHRLIAPALCSLVVPQLASSLPLDG